MTTLQAMRERDSANARARRRVKELEADNERLRAALNDIATEPEQRGNAYVFHGQWEGFARQLVDTARAAIGHEQAPASLTGTGVTATVANLPDGKNRR